MNESLDDDLDCNVISLASYRRKKTPATAPTDKKSTDFQKQTEVIETDRKKHNSHVMASYKIERKNNNKRNSPANKPTPPPRQEKAAPERSVQEYESDVSINERIERIKSSVSRINELMLQLRSTNQEDKNR